jgi:glycerol uptake facilitator-like aquaporin
VKKSSANPCRPKSYLFAFDVAIHSFIPGGHINPAVTSSLFLIGEIDAVTAAAYIVTQFVAAVLGAGLVWGCMADETLKETQGGSEFYRTLYLLLVLLL